MGSGSHHGAQHCPRWQRRNCGPRQRRPGRLALRRWTLPPATAHLRQGRPRRGRLRPVDRMARRACSHQQLRRAADRPPLTIPVGSMPVPYSAVNQPEVRHSASEHSLSTSRTSGQQSPSRIRPAFSRAICEPGRYVENSRSIRSSSASTARTAGCVTEALRMKLNTVPITSYRWRRRSHVTPDIHPRGRWRFRLSPPGSNRATRPRSTYYCKGTYASGWPRRRWWERRACAWCRLRQCHRRRT